VACKSARVDFSEVLMNHLPTKQLLTREQAAQFSGTTVTFLTNCARRRKNGPPFYRYSNQTVLYRRDELERWIDRCRVDNSETTR
jgi:hypothetical protein